MLETDPDLKSITDPERMVLAIRRKSVEMHVHASPINKKFYDPADISIGAPGVGSLPSFNLELFKRQIPQVKRANPRDGGHLCRLHLGLLPD
jgi:hypothetical protein